jgi:hypothetical protein
MRDELFKSLDGVERAAHRQDDRHRALARAWDRVLLRWIACASSLLGVIVACGVANPESLSALSTAQLLGVIVLIVGPALTAFAVRLERRVTSQTLVVEAGTADGPEPRITHHSAHDRVKRVHARVEDSREQTCVQDQAA